ncbi:HAMP domain-containing sensor histidine kinase [Peptostreptococcus sp. D1]|uniref:HAMP domain-containing sensor histidine kinase n=1 Tax=Peptostreptococcus sp. D1 TaxID=72304 RepID=UPI0008F02CEB|nr:HAMP domain-containing sensor histidine kinase [Peptostreptococcus sp. D1]SFE22538.1 Signal transduction histidine kinase [Peptostreptococcus sp. D1]
MFFEAKMSAIKSKKSIIKTMTRNLIASLFIISILSSVGINLVMNNYIYKIAKDSLEYELENTYYSDSVDDTGNRDDKSLRLPTNIFIIDENRRKKVYSSNGLYDKENKKVKLLNEKLSKEDFSDGKTKTVEINGESYFVEMRSYSGFFDIDKIVETRYDSGVKGNEDSKKYRVFAYVNITEAKKPFIDLSLWFLGIFGITVLLAGFFNFFEQKKFSKDLVETQIYLKSIGSKKSNMKKPETSYDEFEEICEAVDLVNDSLLKKEKIQQEFFQNASHQLRTPLMSIQGYREGYESGIIAKAEALDVIRKQTEKMSKLVEEILYISRFEERELDLSKVDLSQLLLQSCDFNRPIDRNIEVEFDLEEKIIAEVDEKSIEKVFDNLFSNAFRHCCHRVIVKIYTIKKSVSACSEIIIQISNDGRLIDKRDLSRIFDRFYKGYGGNTGLGLSIAKDILKKHQGNITVEVDSEFNRFTIVLPQLCHK